MDVSLPDGTMLQGVPDGTTRSAIAAKLLRAGKDVGADWNHADVARIDPAAIAEAKKRGRVEWIPPKDFLRLSPDFKASPDTDRKGKSLKASLDAGEPIKAIPEWTVEKGKIVQHDGRHRAQELMAAGVSEIPVLFKGDIAGLKYLQAEDSKDRIAFKKWGIDTGASNA